MKKVAAETTPDELKGKLLDDLIRVTKQKLLQLEIQRRNVDKFDGWKDTFKPTRKQELWNRFNSHVGKFAQEDSVKFNNAVK